jgi:LCP family protein required for cell wall assembly
MAVTLALGAWVGGIVVGSIGTPHAAAVPVLQIGRAHAAFEPALTGDDPVFILVLGSDSRPGTPLDRGLADSIHVLGINPDAGRATLYGIPRDSWVPLATGGTGKINSAMPAGGVEAELTTVEQLTGITFDYYALTGFDGFTAAVKGIGGLTVDVPYTIEGYSTTFEPGPQRLRGGQPLDFARTRKTLPRGDFDRSLHQGILMVSALAQFRMEYAKDAGSSFTWLGAGLSNVSTDLSIDELMLLANLSLQVKPMNVTNLVAMGSVGTESGLSVVYLSDGNKALWADLADDGYILSKDAPPEYQVQD